MNEFLKLDNVICVGGSWIAPPALINAGNFTEITHIATGSLAAVQ